MMLVCSTAHTFHYKWFVQLVNTLSNQRLDLRQDMVSTNPFHTGTVAASAEEQSQLLQILINTTEELKLLTLCNINKLDYKLGGSLTPLFFVYK